MCTPTLAGLLLTLAPSFKPDTFKIDIDLGNDGIANLNLKQTIQNSNPVVVKYNLPFNLNLAQDKQTGRAICTKDGTNGEKQGDVLRFCTRWSMGLPQGDGMISTVASFGGAIGWQIGFFDVDRARNWDEVVEALVSNTPERSNSATLVFERPPSQEPSN